MSSHTREGDIGSDFGCTPRADAIALAITPPTWRGGPEAGKPKLSPAAKGLLERELMRLDPSPPFPRLFFTEAGLA
jgi:hypothetical protein